MPTLGRVDATRMIVSEYMLYAWTALFSQVLRAGVVKPFWHDLGTWN